MEGHIKKLVEATKHLTVKYSLAYTDGNPDIGVRGSFDNPSKDSIIIDDIVWLIVGDIYNKETHKRVDSVRDMLGYQIVPESIYVSIKAQAIIAGQIVQVSLGNRDVDNVITCVGIEYGYIVLGGINYGTYQ